MFWIRSIFSPIEKIINNIKLIIDNSAYQPISYAKKDEFFPLISAINNLHKSLSIQENIRSNFLTDLSHEIRTPITAVKCYLEAIEDGYMEIDTKTLVLLQKELDRLTTTTEEIMHFERTTHPMEKNIRVKRFDLKKSIIPLVNEYGPQLHKTHQNILINIPDNSYIRMDESMLIQICHNIFSNFIKYA